MDTPELDVTRWNPYDRNCPTRKLLDRLGDRWTVLIIGTLQHGPQRFGELIMNSPTWAAPSSRRSRG